MKKLALNLETLAVTSFEIDAERAERGTVQGNWAPSNHQPRTACCPDTYQVSCAVTCTCP